MDIDFETEAIGSRKDGKNVYLRDIWPSSEEVAEVSVYNSLFQLVYSSLFHFISDIFGEKFKDFIQITKPRLRILVLSAQEEEQQQYLSYIW